jgi:hypothetical protein
MRNLILICVALAALGGGYAVYRHEHKARQQAEYEALRQARNAADLRQADRILRSWEHDKQERQRRADEAYYELLRNRPRHCTTIYSDNVAQTNCD